MQNKKILSLLFFILFAPLQEARSQSKNADYEKLIGRWVRPDGGYVLVINAVDAQGNLDAQYSKPNNINVAKAQANIEEGQMKIYVEMLDIRGPIIPLHLIRKMTSLLAFIIMRS
jgi:hypothetical protein